MSTSFLVPDDLSLAMEGVTSDVLARLRERLVELEVENARLRQLSHHDELTGLANRRGFDAHLEKGIEALARYGSVVTVLALDLDGLKRINDTQGHPAGDDVLRAVARVLTSSLRVSDTPARFGGDEFGIILPQTSEARAVQVAQRLTAAVEKIEVPGGGRVTASIGVAGVVPTSDRQLPLAVVDNPSSDVTVEGVKAKLVDTSRAFRCQSAHKDLAYLKLTEGESGAVLYYRGHRRVLLVMPGWATVCVDAAKADKDPAREAAAAWQAVTRKMIKDRHDNP